MIGTVRVMAQNLKRGDVLVHLGSTVVRVERAPIDTLVNLYTDRSAFPVSVPRFTDYTVAMVCGECAGKGGHEAPCLHDPDRWDPCPYCDGTGLDDPTLAP